LPPDPFVSVEPLDGDLELLLQAARASVAARSRATGTNRRRGLSTGVPFG
jgi:hypothetical protein